MLLGHREILMPKYASDRRAMRPQRLEMRFKPPASSCAAAPCIAHDGEPGGSDQEHNAVATVLIVGASRGIGFETVKAALEAGHSVRALARSARRIPVDHPKLEKMAGDALEMATVKRALTGVDVVTQSLGVSAGPEIILKPTRFFSKATRVLVTAMEEAQVKRLVCVTGFGAGDSRGQFQVARQGRPAAPHRRHARI
jgi:NAD(P)H-binding